MIDWAEVREELRFAVQAAVGAIIETGEVADAYAIALSVAEDGMGIGMAWTTHAHYEDRVASEDEATDEDLTYFRWAPAEWQEESWLDELFADVNDIVSDVAMDEGLDSKEMRKLVDALTWALAGLRETKGEALANVTLFVTITDSDEAEAVENRSAKALNSGALAEAFLGRYASE